MEEGIEITVSILRAGEDEIVPRIGMLGDLEGLLDMSGTSTTRVSGRVLVGGLGDWAGVQICLDRKLETRSAQSCPVVVRDSISVTLWGNVTVVTWAVTH